ncbi:M15 family metallopeptidase [Sphingomonas sp. Leaf21]|uniref:M15 family metallopeptidase n=1 Tax=Sphingomonas sp. Leaf21 TaxID=2876550 RepID=UPI001E40FC49|nr:M15 family metallopeptidase [Sphingomonas sp. Leaf21]
MPTALAVFLRLLALLTIASMPIVAQAQGCDGPLPPPGPDGRVAGHFPYGDASPADIVPAPPGFGLKPYCRLHRAMIPDLQRLLDAARADPSVGGTLHGLSCHREVARQRNVFCRDRSVSAAERAISVAPPGHSEHATGYAIDFAVRPARGCPDAEACMAASPAARWLIANASRFGFEMSFPAGNQQRVKWEPWHWRWVGTSPAEPGAAQARAIFARARAQFPANPGVRDLLKVRVTGQPPVPVVTPVVAPPAPVKRGRRR